MYILGKNKSNVEEPQQRRVTSDARKELSKTYSVLCASSFWHVCWNKLFVFWGKKYDQEIMGMQLDIKLNNISITSNLNLHQIMYFKIFI